MESHLLLRINAQEERFLPVEVKVEWLSSQAAMRSRASAMVGRRIAQLDDAIRVRALLCILRSAAPTTMPTPAAAEGAPPAAAARLSSPVAAGADAASDPAASTTAASPDQAPGSEENPLQCSTPRRGATTPVLAGGAVGNNRGSGGGGTTQPCPALQPWERELFARMAVSKIKALLFQLVDGEEAKERQGRDVFDVYEGLVTTEALEKAAAAGFPALDVDTILMPKHFRYRALVAARHRFLLRKLGVLLDMEDQVETLLKLAADTEELRECLADVDLSSGEDREGNGKEREEGEEASEAIPLEDASITSAATSALLPGASMNAATSALLPGAAAGAVGLDVVKARAPLRNTSWAENEAGNEDTTEGETDEETPRAIVVLHRKEASSSTDKNDIATVEVSPSH